MAVNNSKLVFAFGNQWVKEKDAAPFFGLPAWWRRFMFQVLTPREVTVYLYLCSVMDPNAIAYPTVEQIAEDMAVKSRSVIVEALTKLIELGFLLRGDMPYVGRVMGKRTIYQRPLPHHTILELLKADLIDANLYPTANKNPDLTLTKASDEVVRAGLRRLVGNDDFAAIESLQSPERRKAALTQSLERHMAGIALKQKASPPSSVAEVMKVLEKLTPEMRALVEKDLEEQGELVAPF